MKIRIVRNVFLILLSLLIGAFISGMLLLRLYEDDFGEAIIESIKTQLNAEVIIGNTSFSYFSSFPLVSCDFEDILVKDNQGRELVNAKILGLRLNMYNLLRKSLKLENILIKDGVIHIVYDRKGQANYDILNSSNDEGYIKHTSLDYVGFEDVRLLIDHYKSDWHLDSKLADIKLKYEDNIEQSLFSLSGKAILRAYEQGAWKLTEKLNLELDASGNGVKKTSAWSINSESLKINDQKAELLCNWKNSAQSTIDVSFSIKNGEFEELMSILSEGKYKEDEFKMRGSYDLRLHMKGPNAKGQFPEFKLSGSINKGYFKNRNYNQAFEDVSTNFEIYKALNQSWDAAEFNLHDLKLRSNELSFGLNITGINLIDPSIVMTGSGALSLSALSGLMRIPENYEIKRGVAGIEEMKFSLKRHGETWKLGEVSGRCTFENLVSSFNEAKVEIPLAKVEWSNEVLLFTPFDGALNGQEFRIGGRVKDFRQSLNRKSLKMIIDGRIAGITYEDLLKLGRKDQAILSDTTSEQSSSWTYDIDVLLDIDEFYYDHVEFVDNSVDLEWNQKYLDFTVQTSAFEGALDGRGRLHLKERHELDLMLSTASINIEELLKGFKNFDQEVVEYKNLRGKSNTKSVIRVFWNDEWTFMPNELQVYSDLEIIDGELLGLDMLYAFSDWIKLRDLMHIKFSRMQNLLEISNGKVYVPHMFVQSNAMNLTLAGEHGFDNSIDYSFKINAGQVLWNKVKKYKNDKQALPAKRQGMFNMYYKLRGTVEDYTVENDRDAVQSHFEHSLVHEEIIYEELRRAFPSLIRKEFEPEEWMDMGYRNPKAGTYQGTADSVGLDYVELDEEYIDGF